MQDILIGFAILAILTAAAVYIIKAKKSGVKCIGCPGGCSSGNCSGCSGCCTDNR